MPNDDFYIICPYYHKTLGNTIFCSGIKNQAQNECETFFKQVFTNRQSRNKCIKSLCSGFDYMQCRFAELNYREIAKKI